MDLFEEDKTVEEYETKFRDTIICPYCKHEERDSWEYNNQLEHGEVEIECGECGETFLASMEVLVEYSTRKKPPKGGHG